MRKVFALFGQIAINGIETVNKQLSTVDKEAMKAQRTLAKFGKNIENTGVALTKFTTGPIVALGAGMVALATKTGEYAESLLNLQQTTGLSTDRLQEYKHVADTVGVSYEGLVQKAQVLTARLQGIDKDGSNASKAMAALGVSSRDSTGNLKSMNDLFPEVIAALQAQTDITERNRIAQNLFGKDLKDIAPVLGMTAGELKAMTDQAHGFGLVLDKDAVEAAAKFDDQVGALKSQFQGLFVQLGSSIIPIIKDTFLPIIRDTVVPIMKGFADKVKILADWFNTLSPAVKDSIVLTTGFVAALGPAVIVFGKLIASTKVLFLLFKTNPIGLVITAIGLLVTAGIWLYKNWDFVKEKLSDAWEAIKYVTLQSISYMKQAFFSYLKTYIGGIDLITSKIPGLKNITKSAMDSLQGMIDKEKQAAESRKKLRNELSKNVNVSAIAAPTVPGAPVVNTGATTTGSTDDVLTQVKETAEARVEIEQDATDRIAQIRADGEQFIADMSAQTQVSWIDNLKEKVDEAKNLYNEFGAKIAEIIDGIFQIQVNNLDSQYQKEKAAIENSTMLATEKEAAISKLDAGYDKKRTELLRKQARQDKAMGIFNVIISTAEAVAKALTLVWPLNLVMSALVGVLGAVQVGVIASKPLPFKEGGLVKGGEGGVLAQIGESTDDELVLPMKAGVGMIVDGIMDKISSIFMPDVGTPGLAMAGAGGSTTNTDRSVHLHIGNFMGDQKSLKDLERTLYQFRRGEEQRKGAE